MPEDNHNSQSNAAGQSLQDVFERLDEQQVKNFIESTKVQDLFDYCQIKHPVNKQELLAL